MDEIFVWLGLISAPRPRRAVALRSLVHPGTQRHVLSWTQIGHILHGSESTAKRAYETGIGRLMSVLPREDIEETVGLLGIAAGSGVEHNSMGTRLTA